MQSLNEDCPVRTDRRHETRDYRREPLDAGRTEEFFRNTLREILREKIVSEDVLNEGNRILIIRRKRRPMCP